MKRSNSTSNVRNELRPLGMHISFMSLTHVLAVAEYLNFSHAATYLGVSQPSVSEHIKKLETDLGIVLFERHTRGVRLTEAGEYFVENVKVGIDHLEHAVKTATTYANGGRGSIRIGTQALTSGSFLDDLLVCFREKYPDITVEIMEGSARNIVSKLRADQLDIAFVAGVLDIPDCLSRCIWQETLQVILPANHILANQSNICWDDLSDETFLVRHNGTGPQVNDLITQRLASSWPPPLIQRYDVERHTLLQLIAQGFGISVAGHETSLLNVPGIVFRPLQDEPEPIPFSAVWSPLNQGAILQNLLSMTKK
ncbi:LysR family transcriptional regulator [Ochrobactrum sp. SFR4]|uniref:LysR family transcriptional regulator n=1 Tax=Ochrobactrum sp. SFR4 TaxID=2717368 RepID=UPI002570A544|nr:LysR family transcriptional regulator [Ochrobactrum sp. SFR4]